MEYLEHNQPWANIIIICIWVKLWGTIPHIWQTILKHTTIQDHLNQLGKHTLSHNIPNLVKLIHILSQSRKAEKTKWTALHQLMHFPVY